MKYQLTRDELSIAGASVEHMLKTNTAVLASAELHQQFKAAMAKLLLMREEMDSSGYPDKEGDRG